MDQERYEAIMKVLSDLKNKIEEVGNKVEIHLAALNGVIDDDA